MTGGKEKRVDERDKSHGVERGQRCTSWRVGLARWVDIYLCTAPAGCSCLVECLSGLRVCPPGSRYAVQPDRVTACRLAKRYRLLASRDACCVPAHVVTVQDVTLCRASRAAQALRHGFARTKPRSQVLVTVVLICVYKYVALRRGPLSRVSGSQLTWTLPVSGPGAKSGRREVCCAYATAI